MGDHVSGYEPPQTYYVTADELEYMTRHARLNDMDAALEATERVVKRLRGTRLGAIPFGVNKILNTIEQVVREERATVQSELRSLQAPRP